MLHCSVVSHWLGACTKWSLRVNLYSRIHQQAPYWCALQILELSLEPIVCFIDDVSIVMTTTSSRDHFNIQQNILTKIVWNFLAVKLGVKISVLLWNLAVGLADRLPSHKPNLKTIEKLFIHIFCLKSSKHLTMGALIGYWNSFQEELIEWSGDTYCSIFLLSKLDINTQGPEQNDPYFADDNFLHKSIIVNVNMQISNVKICQKNLFQHFWWNI